MSRVSPWTIEGSTADLSKVLTAFPMGKRLLVLVMGKRQATRILDVGAEEGSSTHHLEQVKVTAAAPEWPSKTRPR